MNEWGIPNWRCPEENGECNRWSFHRWRWEFYRRRTDIREYFEDRASDEFDYYMELFNLNPQAFPSNRVLGSQEPGFTVTVTKEDISKIGYYNLPNPKIGAQPESVLHPAHSDFIVRPIHHGWKHNTIADVLEYAGVELTERQAFRIGTNTLSAVPARLKDGQCALIIDLDTPLEPQLKSAKKYLASVQQERHGKVLQKRRNASKWLGYLRNLDAREDNATWAEISNIHPMTAQKEQTARDIWRQARNLCFNF